ncbi:BACON domain-containing protein [Marinifilum fragile]|uniref:BACON domain-containing protein n=1 Tax=Marinifilum fragile TaxID=570161 RepID=UPI002AABB766|nr:BACON domain-containing carbohydrate-binding protein [Marinifilum fragile]
MKRYFLVICFLLLSKPYLYSQVFEYEREITPTPDASTFIRHNFSEANLYRGAPVISIPIHKLELQEFELPINLNYSYDGLKVGDVPSRVGLGWNLNAGGMISHIVKGKPDESTTGFNYTLNNLNIPDPIQEPETYNLWKTSFSEDKYDMRRVATGQIDGVPDEYLVSVGSLSFSFYHIGDNVFVPNPYSAVKIIKSPNGVQDSWEIIDESGNKYFFGRLSNSESAYMAVDHQSIEGFINYTTYATSWHIRKIETKFGESIVFDYESNLRYKENSYTHFELFEDNPSSNCPSIPPFNTDITYYSSVNENTLLSITSPKEQIILSALTQRNDLHQEDYKKRLDVITIKNLENWFQKKFLFEYDYLGTYNYNSGRLILKGLKEVGISEMNPKQYEFNYYNENISSLPSYTSFSIDHWGYYNGYNNSNLIPKEIEGSAWNNYFTNAAANRESNPEKSITGLMQKIILPTGGSVEYEYEPHDYGATNLGVNPSQLITFDQREELSAIKNEASTEVVDSKRFNIQFEQEVTVNCSVNSNGYPLALDGGIVRLRPLILGETPILELTGSDFSTERHITLQPGSYILEVEAIDVGFSSFIAIDFKAPVKDSEGNLTYQINHETGGHRIKKIIEKDHDLNILGIKTFQYTLTDDPNRSSGVLCRLPEYESVQLHNKLVNLAGPAFNIPLSLADCQYIVRSGHSHVAISSSGSHVGYKEVVVKEEGSANNGSTKYEFTSGSSYPDKVFLRGGQSISRSFLRGLLKKRTVFDATNNPVLIEQNFYDIKLDQQFPIGKGIAGIFVCEFTHDDIQDYNDTFSYPYFGILSSDWVKLIKSTMTHYFDNDSIFIENRYAYENYYHNQISLHEQIDSKNGYKGTLMLYPKDYDNYGIISSLQDLNIQNQPIEKVSFVMDQNGNKKIVGGMIQSFKAQNNTVLLSEVYRSNLNTSKTLVDFKFSNKTIKGLDPFANGNQSSFNKDNIDESYGDTPFTIYDTYNLNNRVTQVHNHLNYEVAYYWGYNQSYPIVKVENSTSSIVQSAVQSSVPSGFSSIEEMLVDLEGLTTNDQKATLKSFNNSIRNNTSLEDAFITTYTYLPTVGMTSQTDPNGVTTYYEYDDYGRLLNVKNDDELILYNYTYHYREKEDLQELNLSKSSLRFTFSSTSQNVDITSNVTWTVSDNASWISISPIAGNGNGSLLVTCSTNNTVKPRVGVITVTGGRITKTISVSQDGTGLIK